MDWLEYFHLNAEKRREVPWAEGVRVTPPMRAEGFWWDCGLIFDEVSAGVFGGAAYPSLAGLRMPEFQWRPPVAE